MKLWRKLLSRHCRSNSDWLDYATNPSGHKPLRRRSPLPACSRAVQCDPDQVMLTNGTQQALYLVMRLLIDPGDATPWKTLAERTPNLSVAGR